MTDVQLADQGESATYASGDALNLQALRTLSLEALREEWLSLFGQPAPATFYSDALAKVIAYERQARAFGDLPQRLKRELRSLAQAQRAGGKRMLTAAPALKPGARLVRTWRGQLHEVFVREEGFEWRGETYRSLSRIAREITGTHWNGLRFFGARSAATSSGERG